MSMPNLDTSAVSKVLGKIVEYPDQYDPSILVRELRSSNRKHINLEHTPMVGSDTWNCWEVSTLTANGVPVSAILKIVYPSTNEYIVESKSLKLYLNSFNMFKCASTVTDTLEFIKTTVMRDLSVFLETPVVVSVWHANDLNGKQMPYVNHSFTTLENVLDTSSITVDTYTETPSLLQGKPTAFNIQKYYHSSLLRSRCKVTHQPDFGDVYISMTSRFEVDEVSLLKYICSFRNENHFHEEICETIYSRLMEKFTPTLLVVKCLYTRRGGIDICPIRANRPEFLDIVLTNPHFSHEKTTRQ